MFKETKNTRAAIAKTGQFILDLLFPKICASCRKEGDFLCSFCEKLLLSHTPSCLVCNKRSPSGTMCAPCRKKTGIARFFAPFSYQHPVIRELIRLYKYESVKEIGRILSTFLIKTLFAAKFKVRRDMVIIPIPLHPRRKRSRGFNQSELLANFLGAAFRIPVAFDSLRRTKNTPPQVSLENDEKRRENITNAFSVIDAQAIAKKTILLVDDVVTSGATLSEAARVLHEAGARSIYGIAVARR